MVVKVKSDLHDEPITFVKFNQWGNYAISFAGGVPEVWDPDTLELPSFITMMSETDLFELCETIVIAAEFSEFYLAVLT